MASRTMSLAEWRRSKGFDNKQAAEHLGVELSYYYKLEAGHVWPQFARVEQIYEATGYAVTPDELFKMNQAGRRS